MAAREAVAMMPPITPEQDVPTPLSPIPSAAPNSTAAQPTLLVRAADIQMENARFLCEPEIPLGVLTIAAGIGGLGKSHYTVEIAARATRGQLPGDLRGIPVEVVMATLEDGLATTVKPRLAAAGANLDLVSFVSLDAGFTIPDDLPRLEAEIQGRAVRLVVLDPLVGYIPMKMDSHKDQHARATVAPLAALAQRHDLAVLAVMHLNKDADASALFLRVSSSIGFLNAARSALLVAPDPEDDGCRILAHGKANLSEPAESRRFRIESAEIQREDGEPIRTSRIAWLGSSAHSIADLLRSDHRADPRDNAERFLRDLLTAGPVEVSEIRQAADANGHAWRTVERAKSDLGIEAFRRAIPGPWWWQSPVRTDPTPPPTPPTREVAALGHIASVFAGQARPPLFTLTGGGLRGGLDGGLPPDPPRSDEGTWRQIQREAGEEPERDETAALALVKLELGATEVAP